MFPTISKPLLFLAFATWAIAQDGPPPGFGPGGPGFGPPGGEERKLIPEFDKSKDGRLDADERKAAREAVKKERAAAMERRGGPEGRRPMGGPFGMEQRDPPKAGIAIKPSDVKPVSEKVSLYEPTILRTLFVDFEGADWEAELADFMHTDVDVPAKLTVDGKTYANVGVSFRGASSLFGVSAGFKRSLNVALDAVDEKQNLLGYRNLNLLNVHGDPSFLHSMLVSFIARQYLPAPKVNHVRVVINGENWGIYANAQQFDRVMLRENFPNPEGARWKAPGSPRGRGGLESFGDVVEEYKRRFELKSKDSDKRWKDLINLCRVLNEAPLDELEARLAPILNVDGVLRFLAVDIVVANDDGYWTRASDYSMFQDHEDRFHVLPHDMNEAFGGGGMPFRPGGGGGPMRRPMGRPPGGEGPPDNGPDSRGMRGGPPGMQHGSPTLDPLTGLDDKRKPLRSRLLAVPSLRERYLRYVRDIAKDWLDWEKLGPIVARQRALIEHEVEIDTRKLTTIDAFRRMTSPDAQPPAPHGAGEEPRQPTTLRAFAEERRRYLLDHPEIRALDAKDRAAPGGQGR